MAFSTASSDNALSMLWSEKRIIAISFFVALSQFQYGFDSSAVSGFQAMPGFLLVFGYKDPLVPLGLNISTTVQTLIQSLMQLGGLVASIFIFTCGNNISRRNGLWCASAFGIVAIIIQMTTTTLAGLYIGRLLLGISNGFYLTYSVTYISEIAPPKIRGSVVGLVTFQTSFGALIGILIDNYTSAYVTRKAYQIPLGVMLAIPTLLAIGVIFLHDSPRYYVSRGRDDKAAESIRKMRGITDEDRIRNDIDEIKAAWIAEKEMHATVRFTDAFRGTDLRRTLISLGCGLGQTATGIIFLSSFSVYFFVQAKIGSPFMWVMVSLAIALTGNMSAFPVMRFVNRRTLLITTSFINCGTMLAMAIVYTVSSPSSTSAGKALVGLSIVFTWMYGIGQGPVLWAVQTETPPQRLRSQVVGLSQGLNFIFAWLCSYCTPYFINPSALNWGPKYCYIWSGSNLILAIWVLLFVPETRNRSLEQLDQMFEKKISTWKFASYTPEISAYEADEKAENGLGKMGQGISVEHVELADRLDSTRH